MTAAVVNMELVLIIDYILIIKSDVLMRVGSSRHHNVGSGYMVGPTELKLRMLTCNEHGTKWPISAQGSELRKLNIKHSRHNGRRIQHRLVLLVGKFQRGDREGGVQGWSKMAEALPQHKHVPACAEPHAGLSNVITSASQQDIPPCSHWPSNTDQDQASFDEHKPYCCSSWWLLYKRNG